MTGSTIMGFETDGKRWVHTEFKSAYVSLTQTLSDKAAVTGRIESFQDPRDGQRDVA